MSASPPPAKSSIIESTARQYALAERAHCLGWPAARVVVIDEDLGLSGASAGNRSGFARLTAEVALGHVGIVLGLEVSRLARNNGDWYRLLDLCGMTDTLIGDADGVYHPAGFNDRLVLGLKGTMSEAELHILRARLDGGIRNKAARGELRRGLPLGFVWGEAPGKFASTPMLPSAAPSAPFSIASASSAPHAASGSGFAARACFPDPGRAGRRDPLGHAHLHRHPPHPGESRLCRRLRLRPHPSRAPPRRARWCPQARPAPARERMGRAPARSSPRHVDWSTFEANRARIAGNTRPRPHQSGGVVREGAALLRHRHLRSLWLPTAHPLSRHRTTPATIALASTSSMAVASIA